MITPKEKIEKFDENFHHVAGICEVGIDPFRDKEDCNCYKEKFKTHLITTIIEEYEETLGEIGEVEKCPACNGSWVECEVCENTGESLGGINKERSRLRIFIESKIQQWKELLNNK